MTPEEARTILEAIAEWDACRAEARRLSHVISEAHNRYMREVGIYGIRLEAFRRELERLAGEEG